MAYTWTDGELITAEKLNETGGGVLIVNVNTGESAGTLDKTWKEIHDAYTNGTTVVVHMAITNVDDGVEDHFDSIVSVSKYIYEDGSTYQINTFVTEYDASSEDEYPSAGGSL